MVIIPMLKEVANTFISVLYALIRFYVFCFTIMFVSVVAISLLKGMH
jgi:hypothetical protein